MVSLSLECNGLGDRAAAALAELLIHPECILSNVVLRWCGLSRAFVRVWLPRRVRRGLQPACQAIASDSKAVNICLEILPPDVGAPLQ